MTERLWVAIPASGAGRRMNSDIPKQYLMLNDRMVIQHTLSCFNGFPPVQGIMVGISENDEYWPELKESKHPLVSHCIGGKERSDTVLNMLLALVNHADKNDWVMIHDAARPCVSQADLDNLWQAKQSNNDGAILAVPVNDTMKQQSNDTRINKTVDRSGLWHAYTPQMFKIGMLIDALQTAQKNNHVVTDDASAMELAGYQPLLVEGSRSNIKITRPDDLALASFYLSKE